MNFPLTLMKTIRRLFLAGLLPILCGGFAPPALRPVESKPVNVGGLEFSVVTEADWNPVFSRSSGVPLVLQLKIRNTTEAALLFPTLDSFHPVLTDATGKELRMGGGRDGTIITPNLLILPGKDFCWQIEARIRIEQTKAGDRLKIEMEDGTGSFYDASVVAGVCRIGFKLSPAHYDFAKEGKLEAKLWAAEGKTEVAEVTIHPARRN
jgi:hypothetical protein